MMYMNKFQKFLSMLLAMVLLLTWAPLASLAEEGDIASEEEIVFPDELIVGHPTITKGDFFTEMFGNNTADIDVRALIHGYNLVNWDQNQGTYVFDPSVVRRVVARTSADGYREYSLVLADNLYYSDGTKITAWDYAFSILLMMSPEIEEIGGKIYRAEHLVDYDQYIAARRKAMAGEELDPAEDLDYLTGVTVLSDYQLRFWLDPDFLPYFFETGLLLTVPYPISVIAPGCKVTNGIVDEAGNPLGIKIVNDDEHANEPPIYTADLLRKTILDPETGYNTFPSVVSGPYKILSWDGVTSHFEKNPYFKGAWMDNNLPGMDAIWEKARANGQIVLDQDEFGNPVLDSQDREIELVVPSIEKIAFTLAQNETMIEKLENEELHLVNKITYSPTIMQGLQTSLQRQNYPRIGLSFLTFSYDWPTVNEMEVRQAIAWCMDRDKLVRDYCGAFGLRMDGYFGIEQWEYQLVTKAISYPVNFLTDIDALGTKIEDEDEDLERYRNMKNMWVETQEDYEKAIAAWDFLADRWDDGEGHTLLNPYGVDLDTANRLLDKAKWTLNRNGEPYQAGVDDVRCKEVNGQLIPLDLKMMFPAGNHMAEFMLTDKDTWTLNQDGGEYNQFNAGEVRCKEINGQIVPLDINNFYDENGELVDYLPEEGSFVSNLNKVGIKLTLVPTPMQDLLHSYYRETERTTDMIYLATNFHVIVDPSITYSIEDTDSIGHAVWNNTYSDDEELYRLAVSMRKTEPGDTYGYVSKWMDFQDRYNEVLPTIPIYSNIYYDYFNEYLQNYEITARVTWTQAILLAYFGAPEEPVEAEEELAEGEETFD